MRRIGTGLAVLAAVWVVGAAQAVRALEQPGDHEAAVRRADDMFWRAYNACDLPGMMALLTEDMEFYHDRGGLTQTRAAFADALDDSLCGPSASRMRREPLPDTVAYYPLAGFGAVLSGEHLFYVRAPDAEERLDARARYFHVWRLVDGEWRMHRVLSFDHRTPPAEADPAEVQLAPEALARLAGLYRSSTIGEVRVEVQGATLDLIAGGKTITLHAESGTRFYVPGGGPRFEFRDLDGGSAGMLVVEENGLIVDEAPRID